MGVDRAPDTGMIEVVAKPAEGTERTYILLPVLDGLGTVSVFSDGSYTRWAPGTTG